MSAERWGHPSHGMLRLPWYVRRLQTGVMSARSRPDVVRDGETVVVLDGRDGIGQVIAVQAMDLAVERALAHGIAAVGVRRSNHFGMAGYYSRRAVRAGCIGICISNASPAMAPWGGREKSVGNNPWSIAAPAGTHDAAVLDIANTVVARGKVVLAQARGESIPEGWALDANGEPTTDPQAALGGSIQPMAGHKGFAVAVMMDVLAGVLTGAEFGRGVHGPYQARDRSGAGHLFLAMDVARFSDPDAFADRMQSLVDQLHHAPRSGDGHISYPGEPECAAAERADREGIVLAAGTIDRLGELAAELALAPPSGCTAGT